MPSASSSSRRGLLNDSHRSSRAAAGPSSTSGGGTSTPASAQRKRHGRHHNNADDDDDDDEGDPGTSSFELPDYEPPAFPLDAAGRKALTELSTNTGSSRQYDAHMGASLEKLKESVQDINDAYTERKTKLKNHQARRRAQQQQQQQQQHQQQEDDEDEDGEDGGAGAGADGEKKAPERADEKAVLALRDEVPDLSDRIEAAVREVIDMQVQLVDGKQALADAARQAEDESARVAAKQREKAAAKQARIEAREAAREERAAARRAAARRDDGMGLGDGDGDEDDEGDEEEEEEDDEDEDVEMQDEEDVTGPLLMLEEAKHRLATEYQSKSMYARYGKNNDYISFKKLWHDAVHGEEGKPLPDASRWFSERDDGSAENGGRGGGRRRQGRNDVSAGDEDEDNDDDDDDDLVIDQEHVSLHCPLSLQIMKDPYTSRKCRHTFDRDSIRAFLVGSASTTSTRFDSVEKQCPQTGCSEMVCFNDFFPDQVMLRRVKRAEESQRNMAMDEDEDGYDEEHTVASVRMTQARTIKTEKKVKESGRRRRVEDVDDEDED